MKSIDVVKNRKVFFIISAVLIFICIGSLIFKGLNFGIDFKGGTIIHIEMHDTFETEDVRDITDAFDENADITYAGEEMSQLVINSQEDLSRGEVEQLFGEFQNKYNLENDDLLSSDKVSGAIGSELRYKSLLACGVAILLMMAYISFRFEFLFAISAAAALAFDILIVLGFYSIFEIQVNSPFIAALLTILGYSVNDTIVVFDRIRERRKSYKHIELKELVNDSITQTLGRTINTTLTTLLAILAIFVMGSRAMSDFILPLIVGFISGAYSSIFIANSLWYVLEVRRIGKKA